MAEPQGRRILIPIDPSEHSKRAIQWYLDKFARKNDTVHLLYVAEAHHTKHVTDATTAEYASEFDGKMRESVKAGEQMSEERLQMIADRGLQVKFSMHVGNKPGEVIVNFANDRLMDVIVIGNRGMGTIRRTVLGSVSDYVLHHVNIPVVLIPPPRPA